MARLPEGMKGKMFLPAEAAKGNARKQAPIYPNGMTERQFKFCQGMLEGMSQSDAYRAAFDCAEWDQKSVHVAASKLRKNAKVALTLSQAVHEAGKLIVVTTESLTHQAREAFEIARQNKQPGAMIASTHLMAKLHGLIIDRSEKRIDDRRMDKGRMTEIKAEAMKLAQDLGFQLVLPNETIIDVTPDPQEITPTPDTSGNDEP